MIVHCFFETLAGVPCRFRLKHPAESFRGAPGIYAITIVEDAQVRAVHFEPANDLGCIDEPQVQSSPMLRAMRRFTTPGFAVHTMRNSTPEHRSALAEALNAALEKEAA